MSKVLKSALHLDSQGRSLHYYPAQQLQRDHTCAQRQCTCAGCSESVSIGSAAAAAAPNKVYTKRAFTGRRTKKHYKLRLSLQ
eukprot:19312-Heterococcus_DN1.PRE.1